MDGQRKEGSGLFSSRRRRSDYHGEGGHTSLKKDNRGPAYYGKREKKKTTGWESSVSPA